MKTKIDALLGICLIGIVICGNLSAQDVQKDDASLSAGPQAVTNHAVTNPDVLVVTGKIIDAVTKLPIANAKINFDKFGEELLQASIDNKGNYALAMSKKELGEPVRVIFKVAGYKRYVIKKINKSSSYVDADIYLQPLDSNEKSAAQVKYIMNDDPFNTMVIKMQ